LRHRFNLLHEDDGGRQAFADHGLWFMMLAATHDERHDAGEEQAEHGV
jgi:hypothetical protein